MLFATCSRLIWAAARRLCPPMAAMRVSTTWQKHCRCRQRCLNHIGTAMEISLPASAIPASARPIFLLSRGQEVQDEHTTEPLAREAADDRTSFSDRCRICVRISANIQNAGWVNDDTGCGGVWSCGRCVINNSYRGRGYRSFRVRVTAGNQQISVAA